MKNDELEKMTDEQLSEAFALEVAGWTFYDGEPTCYRGSEKVPWGQGQRAGGKRWTHPEHAKGGQWHLTRTDATKHIGFAFATSADAVIEHLTAWQRRDASFRQIETYQAAGGWIVQLRGVIGAPHSASWPTFARAAATALILATRAAAEAKERTNFHHEK